LLTESQDDLEQDPVLKDRYMVIDRIDGKCTWVSKKVLRLLPEKLGDTSAGELDSRPSRGVFCGRAMNHINRIHPMLLWNRRRRLLKATRKLNSMGIVGIHDAGLSIKDAKNFGKLAGHKRRWNLRVYGMLQCAERNTFCPKESQIIIRADHKFILKTVKLYAGT
jgi:predicted amidohydrolase YtcJ